MHQIPARRLYISYRRNLAAGGTIVLVAHLLLLANWVIAPRYSLIGKARARRRSRSIQPEQAGAIT
jgi:hypothetical protein